jgi:hypothetical protein
MSVQKRAVRRSRQRSGFAASPGTAAYDFKNVFAEKFGEKIGGFLLKLLLVFAKIGSQHWFLRNTPIFSSKIGKITRKKLTQGGGPIQ